MTPDFTVRALKASDKRAAFHSGDLDLDGFFARYAGQNQFRHHVGVTYVAVDATERILGYITLSASCIEITDLPDSQRRALPHYPLPVLRVARLATDLSARGLGVAASLTRYAFQIAHEMAESVGCVGVVVDAKPQAVSFYSERFGFIPLEVRQGALGDRPRPTPMFLALASTRPQ